MTSRNIRTTIAALFAVSAVAIGLGVHAAEGKGEHGKHGADRFKQADKDGDGKLSKDEAAAMPRLAKQFDQVDTNKDGFLSKDELQAMRAKHGEHRQARPDTDRDGNITRAEAERFPKLKENFDKIDANKDGVISKDEMKAAHERKKQG